MTIYRNKKDGNLYNLYLVSPRMYTGSWYEAVSLHGNVVVKHANPDNFIPVSYK